MLAKVLFPEPLGPIIAWTSPGLMYKDKPFKMDLLSTFAERLLILSISQRFLPSLFLQAFELLQQIPWVTAEELPYKNH